MGQKPPNTLDKGIVIDVDTEHPKWIARSGEAIPIAEMTHGHLRNTISMLERWIKDESWLKKNKCADDWHTSLGDKPCANCKLAVEMLAAWEDAIGYLNKEIDLRTRGIERVPRWSETQLRDALAFCHAGDVINQYFKHQFEELITHLKKPAKEKV